MIQRVGNVEIAVRIQCDRPWITELPRQSAGPADDLERPILRVKYLDPAVAKFAHVLRAGLVDADVVGITQLAQTASWFAKTPYQGAIARKDLDPMVARVCDMDQVLSIGKKAFRPVELARRISQLSNTPQALLALRIELLNSFSKAVFADEDFIMRIHANGAWKRELPRIGAVRAPLKQKLAFGREMVDALVMRLDHKNV